MDPAAVAFVGVLVAAGAGVGGAILGARIAANSARDVIQLTLDEGRRTRFHDDVREAATALYQAVEHHADQRRRQFIRWGEVAQGIGSPDSIPTVDATGAIHDAALALDIVASTATSDAGWRLWLAAVKLDAFEYNAGRDQNAEGEVSAATIDFSRAFAVSQQEHELQKLEFVNAVRSEFGLAPVSALGQVSFGSGTELTVSTVEAPTAGI